MSYEILEVTDGIIEILVDILDETGQITSTQSVMKDANNVKFKLTFDDGKVDELEYRFDKEAGDYIPLLEKVVTELKEHYKG